VLLLITWSSTNLLGYTHPGAVDGLGLIVIKSFPNYCVSIHAHQALKSLTAGILRPILNYQSRFLLNIFMARYFTFSASFLSCSEQHQNRFHKVIQ
jgi:hypothetical protein